MAAFSAVFLRPPRPGEDVGAHQDSHARAVWEMLTPPRKNAWQHSEVPAIGGNRCWPHPESPPPPPQWWWRQRQQQDQEWWHQQWQQQWQQKWPQKDQSVCKPPQVHSPRAHPHQPRPVQLDDSPARFPTHPHSHHYADRSGFRPAPPGAVGSRGLDRHGGPQTGPGRPLGSGSKEMESLPLCGECAQQGRPGRVDESDGRWYCHACWSAWMAPGANMATSSQPLTFAAAPTTPDYARKRVGRPRSEAEDMHREVPLAALPKPSSRSGAGPGAGTGAPVVSTSASIEQRTRPAMPTGTSATGGKAHKMGAVAAMAVGAIGGGPAKMDPAEAGTSTAHVAEPPRTIHIVEASEVSPACNQGRSGQKVAGRGRGVKMEGGEGGVKGEVAVGTRLVSSATERLAVEWGVESSHKILELGPSPVCVGSQNKGPAPPTVDFDADAIADMRAIVQTMRSQRTAWAHGWGVLKGRTSTGVHHADGTAGGGLHGPLGSAVEDTAGPLSYSRRVEVVSIYLSGGGASPVAPTSPASWLEESTTLPSPASQSGDPKLTTGGTGEGDEVDVVGWWHASSGYGPVLPPLLPAERTSTGLAIAGSAPASDLLLSIDILKSFPPAAPRQTTAPLKPRPEPRVPVPWCCEVFHRLGASTPALVDFTVDE